MALKTMQDGYVANIKMMMRFEIIERNYRDPFSGARICWPRGYELLMTRERLDAGVLNPVFKLGCASGSWMRPYCLWLHFSSAAAWGFCSICVAGHS